MIFNLDLTFPALFNISSTDGSLISWNHPHQEAHPIHVSSPLEKVPRRTMDINKGNLQLRPPKARNQLAIVALFISFVYGTCALFLGLAVGNLSTLNETLLVVFIISFPIFVLCIFAWLVLHHHAKLYAPSDFRDDRNFVELAKPAPPTLLGDRLAKDLTPSGDGKKIYHQKENGRRS